MPRCCQHSFVEKDFSELADIVDISSSVMRTQGDLYKYVAHCFWPFQTDFFLNQQYIKHRFCLTSDCPFLVHTLYCAIIICSLYVATCFSQQSIFSQTLQEWKTYSYIPAITLIFNQTRLSCRTAEQSCNLCWYTLVIFCTSCFILSLSSIWRWIGLCAHSPPELSTMLIR